MSGWRVLLRNVCVVGCVLVSAPAWADGVRPQVLAPAQALAWAQSGHVLLIDVRTRDEWRQGVPPAAHRISLNDPRGPAGFVAAVYQAVQGDMQRPVAVICRTGHRSSMAAALLADAGFTRVYDVSEGVVGGRNGPGWGTRGLPLILCGSCASGN